MDNIIVGSFLMEVVYEEKESVRW